MNRRNSAQKRITNVMKKEWKVVFSDLNSGMFVTVLPFIIMVQALVVLYLVSRYAGPAALQNTILRAGMEKWLQVFPEISQLSVAEQFQVFFMGQIPYYFLLIPTMIAVSFATFSIVEEKQTRTLEPLLATPVRTWELLLGKSLAGLFPSLILTWIVAGCFLGMIAAIGWGNLIQYVVNRLWVVSLVLLVPLISFLSFMLGVIGSSRARDPKGAQNLAIIIVLPVLAIVIMQLVGVTVLVGRTLLFVCMGMVVLDIVFLKAAVGLFQRESIVITWR
ncbi:MAG: ABC transporter permease subunit [Theionarchaea archaeon]|nr:ABC transporter permease subunit [Theionarchaea archaeon]MBU7000245.1 ABC transporter permease subunit [Theionarchaea archaeon]MBU7022046.1 ABC transporter permease subunit [Theionarchaea archaeon]MBU7034728.1 ABC transporter permease subunit [Theionarchaea archaeon]MBU7041658.1 ABC transporter permease subunit [Theionarchaea archaeon]